MQTIHLQPSDPTAQRINAVTFRSNTKTFKLQVHESGGMNLASYWDGGSRDTFMILQLSTMKALVVPQNGSGYDAFGFGIDLPLPAADFAVIESSMVRGENLGITIHIHASNATALLPKSESVSWAEQVVLIATRGLKSSYAGIKDYRFAQANEYLGITRNEWDFAKIALIERKLLNAAGALMVDGRNAAGTKDIHSHSMRRICPCCEQGIDNHQHEFYQANYTRAYATFQLRRDHEMTSDAVTICKACYNHLLDTRGGSVTKFGPTTWMLTIDGLADIHTRKALLTEVVHA